MKISLLVLALLSGIATGFADTASLVVLKNGTLVDGRLPYGSLAVGKGGVLYGTFNAGGAGRVGTLFRMNANGASFVDMLDFLATTGDSPYGGPTVASDGRLYGVTSVDGADAGGTIYRFDPATSACTVLHDFVRATDGGNSNGRLVEGSDDGKLYGTTNSGGANGTGTIFRINKDGSGFTVLHAFTGATDGQYPTAAPIFGRDKRLYGTCYSGGANGGGTIYAVNTDGTGFTVLWALANATDGAGPTGELVEGPDRFLYGTAYREGPDSGGTIFRLGEAGTAFQVLKSFSNQADSADDGYASLTGLTVGADGKLYGTTTAGGAINRGTLFSIQTDGVFAKLADFTPDTGYYSDYGSLTQIAPLVFVGSAMAGGANNLGAIFKFTAAVAAPTITPKKKHLVTAQAKARITGIAASVAGIAKVKYRVGSGRSRTAKGTTRWSFKGALKPGKNTITVTAYDTRGNASKPVKIRVTRN